MGFRVQGLGFKDRGLEVPLCDLGGGIWAWGLEFQVLGLLWAGSLAFWDEG